MKGDVKQTLKRLLASINLGYVVPMSRDEKLRRLENDPAWRTVDLPVDGRSDRVEEVLVETVDADRYRVASSPGMVRGLAAGDVIALDPQSPAGFRLLQRGGNVCVHVFCDAARRDATQAALTQTLGRIGGRLDGTMGRTGLCFTVPVMAGFTAIEGALQRVVGDEWSYSNVYDPETNAPLNWWLKPPKAAKKDIS